MNINQLLAKKNIKSNNSYLFLEANSEIMDNLLFLTLGGSHAYGTNIEGSDVDVRGIDLNTKDEILLNMDHEQSINEATDTTIYTLNKYLKLIYNCNPNTIEMLGSIDRNALFVHPYFKKIILNNIDLFLSRNAFFTFGGYARAQMNRLNNKLGRTVDEIEAQNIIRSIENAKEHFKDHYGLEFGKDVNIVADGVKFSLNVPDLSKENMQSCLNEIASILKDYNKLGKRNKNAIEHKKLNKHFMHLARLFLMGIDILEKGEINTYRDKDHDLLMSMRNNVNNEWITENNGLTNKAQKFIDEHEVLLKKAFDNSKLPDKPDMNKINNLKKQINLDIINESWR